MRNRDVADAWSNYWHADRADSLIASDSDRAAINAKWQAFLAELPQSAAILDVATGNGSLAVLAALSDKKFAVTGTDIASIDPAIYVSKDSHALKNITFIGGCPSEELPFNEAEFTAVISQYGFEYADRNIALSEMARVLKPGGRLMLLTHHRDSEVVKPNTAQIEQITELTERADIFDRARKIIQTTPISTAAMRTQQMQGLDAAGQMVLKRFADQTKVRILQEVFAGIGKIISLPPQVTVAEKIHYLDDMLKRLKAEGIRLQGLSDAAMDEGDVEALKQAAVNMGLSDFSFSSATVGADKALVGWWITAVKS